MIVLTYSFDQEQLDRASKDWGANCGPGALAFVLQVGIDKVRGVIPHFEDRRYTNVPMMRAGLRRLGLDFRRVEPSVAGMFDAGGWDWDGDPALVLVQWTGPWTAEGARPCRAARHRHWIASWVQGREPMVFDINAGVCSFARWESEAVPAILSQHAGADGGWRPACILRVAAPARGEAA